jgi:hypothetical protein
MYKEMETHNLLLFLEPLSVSRNKPQLLVQELTQSYIPFRRRVAVYVSLSASVFKTRRRANEQICFSEWLLVFFGFCCSKAGPSGEKKSISLPYLWDVERSRGRNTRIRDFTHPGGPTRQRAAGDRRRRHVPSAAARFHPPRVVGSYRPPTDLCGSICFCDYWKREGDWRLERWRRR